MFDLSGKKALVTGSTQGIGFAIAKLLADCGAEVIIHGATSEEKCRKAAAQIGGKTQIAVANLADSDCAENLYRQTGDVDILVLNASVQVRKHWDEITAEEFELQIHTNLKASLMLIQKYVKHMQAQSWGRIVTVGSVQEYTQTTYHISGRSFVVQPVFKPENNNTLGEVLLRLMQAECEKSL